MNEFLPSGFKTHTDRYLYANSHHHLTQTTSSVMRTLLARAVAIIDKEHQEQEFKNLKQTQSANRYSERIINKCFIHPTTEDQKRESRRNPSTGSEVAIREKSHQENQNGFLTLQKDRKPSPHTKRQGTTVEPRGLRYTYHDCN